MLDYTTKHPCRCGFDGTGEHLCHYSREYPGERCQVPGITKLVPTPGSLAGMQMKFACIDGTYCQEHWDLLPIL